jgi:hypothetical protein
MHELKLVSLLLGLNGVISGCGTDPSRSDVVHYQVALSASGGDSTADRVRTVDCVIGGFFDVASSDLDSGVAHFPVSASRSLIERSGSHFEQTSADTTLADAVLNYTGLGSGSPTFTFGAGAYTVTLGPGAPVPTEPGEYAGVWSCGPDAPLAQDSTLVAYGYDPNGKIEGIWRVTEMRPFE